MLESLTFIRACAPLLESKEDSGGKGSSGQSHVCVCEVWGKQQRRKKTSQARKHQLTGPHGKAPMALLIPCKALKDCCLAYQNGKSPMCYWGKKPKLMVGLSSLKVAASIAQ